MNLEETTSNAGWTIKKSHVQVSLLSVSVRRAALINELHGFISRNSVTVCQVILAPYKIAFKSKET